MPGSYCALVQCHHQETRDPCRFFKISRKNKAQTSAWTLFINRINPDGSEWEPNSKSVICSCHFVGGGFSKDPSNPSYAPTILEPVVVTPPKVDSSSIMKVPIVVSLPKRAKFESIDKETKSRGRRGRDVKQEIITQECDFCGFIFCGQSLTEFQTHNCLQEESSSSNNTDKSKESKYGGDHFMANSLENTVSTVPSRIVVSPPKKKKKYDVVVKIPNPNTSKRPEPSKNTVAVKQEPLETMYRDPNTSKNTQVKSKSKSNQVIVVSLPKKSKKPKESKQNINTEIILPESYGPPVVDELENVVKQPEKARLKCDFCDIHLRSTGSAGSDRSTIRIHMKMEHPNVKIPSNHTSNKFTKTNFTTVSSSNNIKTSAKNVNEESDFEETFVKQEPPETLPEPEAAEPILEDPPTLSEFIESLQTARKFLESRGDVSDREHESLLNLESFAIKEAEKHFT